MKDFFKKITKDKKVLSYLIIFFVSIFLCIPLFSKYMDISRDDGIQHICRLIGTEATLKEGNLFPVIMSDFCNGFGYSWNLFYSPLTAYIPLLFRIITSSYVVCLKLFMFLTVFLSGVCMYQFTHKITKSYKAGVVCALLYMSAPYHLTDMYRRIAIAELASFVFLPIVFNGMYDLLHRRNKKPYGIVFGAIGLILTHNVMTVYTAIFCFVYLLINYKKLTMKGTTKKILICILLILLCTSFYWIPLLEHMMATTYEVFIPQRMYKDNTLISSKLSVSNLFITEFYEMNFHIGLPILLGMLLIFCYRKKIPNRYRKTINVFFIFGLISTIMTLKIFPFEYLPSTLKMIQFPWRMMEFSSFFFSVVAGTGFAMLLNRNRKKEIYIVIFLMICMSVSLLKTKTSVEIPFNEEKYLQPIPVTASTRRVHAGLASFEYLPKKAFQDRGYIEQRSQDAIVLVGEANISKQNKNGSNMNIELEKASENTKIELPYIYYLGYSAKLEKEDGTKQDLKIEESDNGFCTITVPNIDKGNVYISYKGTTWMKISYITTIAGIATIVWLSLKKRA